MSSISDVEQFHAEDSVQGRSLAPHVLRFLRARVRRGELTPTVARNHWSTLRLLADVHGARPVNAVNVATIERWLEARAAVKPSTRVTQWSSMHLFLDWLVRERLLRENPMARMRSPRKPRSVPRAMDEDSIGLLLEVAPDARAKAIVWLMVGLGLRCVEVHRLKVEDWSRGDASLLIEGKAGHQREIPVTDEVATALSAYLTEHPASSGPLLRSYYQNRSLAPGTLSHYMSEWMLVAGVKSAANDGVSAHALRHTAASDVLDRCGDLRVVQQMLGHQHLSSTSIYLRRVQMVAMREAMAGRGYRSGPNSAPA
ncbi:MAG: integrase/recombinase XerC [Acidimicrobiaceae bacterium]